mgnify:CR=1 FL=1
MSEYEQKKVNTCNLPKTVKTEEKKKKKFHYILNQRKKKQKKQLLRWIL